MHLSSCYVSIREPAEIPVCSEAWQPSPAWQVYSLVLENQIHKLDKSCWFVTLRFFGHGLMGFYVKS